MVGPRSSSPIIMLWAAAGPKKRTRAGMPAVAAARRWGGGRRDADGMREPGYRSVRTSASSAKAFAVLAFLTASACPSFAVAPS